MVPHNQIIQGDAIQILASLLAGCVDLIVTISCCSYG